MKTAIYLRKSRSEEITDTAEETLQRHKETLLKYALQNSLTIEAIYEEVVSGESLYARPQMLMLLEDIEKGLYEAVLCMDIDRLGRGAMSDQGIILESFKNANVKIITPRKIYDLNNEFDEEYTEFETFMARRELKMIKRRMQRGKHKTVEDGGYVANPPYGYTRTYIDKKPTLEINEKEAHFVRLAFDMYVNQSLGAQIIADTLSSLGAVPHRGKKFSRNSIRFILKNPVYIGKIVWNRNRLVRKGHKNTSKNSPVTNSESRIICTIGLHPAIIDEAIFDRAQEIRENRIKPPYNKGILKNPLSGLIFCSECGKSLRRATFKKADGTSGLLCDTKGCVKATRFDRVETAILSTLEDIFTYIKLEHDSSISIINTEKMHKTLDFVKKEIETIDFQINKLHDLLEQGIYDIETYNKRLKILYEKSNKLKTSYEKLSTKLLMYHYNSSNKAPQIDTLFDVYTHASIKKKNELLKSIINKVVYYKAKDWAPDQFKLDIYLKDIDLPS